MGEPRARTYIYGALLDGSNEGCVSWLAQCDGIQARRAPGPRSLQIALYPRAPGKPWVPSQRGHGAGPPQPQPRRGLYSREVEASGKPATVREGRASQV